MFECLVGDIQYLLQTPAPVLHKKGIKLPKIDVPRFEGDIMNWQSFWQQYEISIYFRTPLSEAEKLDYGLAYGCGRKVSLWLTLRNEYDEAKESFQMCHDMLCLLHQVHANAIVEFPALKEGNS